MLRMAALASTRRVDADGLAVDQVVLGQDLQDLAEHLLMRSTSAARAGARQPGRVGSFLPVRQPQKNELERTAVVAAPVDAPLGVDPLEVPDHVHPEIPPRRKRRRAHPRRVIRLAHPFNERVEPGFPKQVLQAILERVSRRARHLRPRRHQIALNRLRSPHRHR